MGCPTFTPKTAPFLRLKSNTVIPRLTPLTTPNGIRIQSAVSPQYTFADRQMGTRMFRNISAPLAMLIESDVLIMSKQCNKYMICISTQKNHPRCNCYFPDEPVNWYTIVLFLYVIRKTTYGLKWRRFFDRLNVHPAAQPTRSKHHMEHKSLHHPFFVHLYTPENRGIHITYTYKSSNNMLNISPMLKKPNLNINSPTTVQSWIFLSYLK